MSRRRRDRMRTPAQAGSAPPRLSGALPLLGHMVPFARDPVALMRRVRAECGAGRRDSTCSASASCC